MSTGRDFAASAAGNVWVALVQIAFVPVYVRLLGVEAYGLIGIYAVLQATLVLLDSGLTPTINREVALARAGAREVADVRDLLGSMEVVLALVAVIVVVAGSALSPWAARSLNIEKLPTASAARALSLMAALVALRLFIGVQRGVIAGSREVRWFAGQDALFATLRSAGVVPVLLVWPTIETFFTQQVGVTLLETWVVRRKAWSLLAGGRPARPSFESLRKVGHFSAGMLVFAAASLVLTQADKVIVSALLPLGDFGYYALASSVAGSLGLPMASVGLLAYPRLNALSAHPDAFDLRERFHDFAQLVTVAIVPVGLLLAFFPLEILILWTRDPVLSAAAAPLLRMLAFGAMLAAFLYLPCLLVVAGGRSLQAAWICWAVAAVYVPAAYHGVSVFGPAAAACAWMAANFIGLALVVSLPLSALPAAHKARWIGSDVLLPAFAALAAIGLARVGVDAADLRDGPGLAVAIMLAGGAALIASIASSASARSYLRENVATLISWRQ
jgi:O-antigen/teichoic acid export membrane protein